MESARSAGVTRRTMFETYQGRLPTITEYYYHRTPEMMALIERYMAEIPRWIRGSRPYRVNRDDEFEVTLDGILYGNWRNHMDLGTELSSVDD